MSDLPLCEYGQVQTTKPMIQVCKIGGIERLYKGDSEA